MLWRALMKRGMRLDVRNMVFRWGRRLKGRELLSKCHYTGSQQKMARDPISAVYNALGKDVAAFPKDWAAKKIRESSKSRSSSALTWFAQLCRGSEISLSKCSTQNAPNQGLWRARNCLPMPWVPKYFCMYYSASRASLDDRAEEIRKENGMVRNNLPIHTGVEALAAAKDHVYVLVRHLLL